MLFADATTGMTGWDFLHANWGTVSSIIVGIGLFVASCSGAITYGIRTVWNQLVEWFGPVVQEHRSLIKTMKEEAPKQTAAQTTLCDTVRVMDKRDSDFRDVVRDAAEAVGDITYAIEESVECPETRKEVERHTRRARQRLGLEKKPAKDSDS